MPRRGLGLEQSSGRQERCEAVPRRVLVLGKAVADGSAIRRCRGGFLIVTWTNEKVARRVGGKALSEVGAEGKAARRSGGGGLGKAGAEGKAVKRFGGGVRCGDGGREWPGNLG